MGGGGLVGGRRGGPLLRLARPGRPAPPCARAPGRGHRRGLAAVVLLPGGPARLGVGRRGVRLGRGPPGLAPPELGGRLGCGGGPGGRGRRGGVRGGGAGGGGAGGVGRWGGGRRPPARRPGGRGHGRSRSTATLSGVPGRRLVGGALLGLRTPPPAAVRVPAPGGRSGAGPTAHRLPRPPRPPPGRRWGGAAPPLPPPCRRPPRCA